MLDEKTTQSKSDLRIQVCNKRIAQVERTSGNPT